MTFTYTKQLINERLEFLYGRLKYAKAFHLNTELIMEKINELEEALKVLELQPAI